MSSTVKTNYSSLRRAWNCHDDISICIKLDIHRKVFFVGEKKAAHGWTAGNKSKICTTTEPSKPNLKIIWNSLDK